MSAVAEMPEEEQSSNGSSFTAPPQYEVADLPDWYSEFQNRAWRDFSEFPMPTRRNEEWRFANLKLSKLDGVQVAQPIQELSTDLAGTRLEEVSARFVFANNRLVSSEVVTLPDGVVCVSMNEALSQHGELVREHFMREEAHIGGQKYHALHGSATLSGIFVHVPKGVVVEKPIEVTHYASGEGSTIFPHTLIVAEANTSVTVLEHFESLNDDDETLCIGMTDLAASDGGHIEYVGVQRWNNVSRHYQFAASRGGRDSQTANCLVNLGSRWTRNETVSRLKDTGADSKMMSVNLARGDQEFDQRTLQLHDAPHTTSDLLYKNALYNDATTIFSGLIRVGEGAHYTDAFQTCRNLLGSETAVAHSMPGLEIDADQVKCSHGSTSGQISEEEIFYLCARGIDPETARRMISFGFLNETLQRIKCEAIRDLVSTKVEKRFAGLA